jgi:hypothetical protein
MDVEVERIREDLQYMSVQESRAPTLEKEEVLLSNPSKEPQRCKVPMPRGDKNNNGKRKPVTRIT